MQPTNMDPESNLFFSMPCPKFQYDPNAVVDQPLNIYGLPLLPSHHLPNQQSTDSIDDHQSPTTPTSTSKNDQAGDLSDSKRNSKRHGEVTYIKGVAVPVYDPANFYQSDISSESSYASSFISPKPDSAHGELQQQHQLQQPFEAISPQNLQSPARSAPPDIAITDERLQQLSPERSDDQQSNQPSQLEDQTNNDTSFSTQSKQNAISSQYNNVAGTTLEHQSQPQLQHHSDDIGQFNIEEEQTIATQSHVSIAPRSSLTPSQLSRGTHRRASSVRIQHPQETEEGEKETLEQGPINFALFYGEESSASPASSAHVSRRLSRRISHAASSRKLSIINPSYDAGIQPEPLLQTVNADVSARRSISHVPHTPTQSVQNQEHISIPSTEVQVNRPGMRSSAQSAQSAALADVDTDVDAVGFVVVGKTQGGATIVERETGNGMNDNSFLLVIDLDPLDTIHSTGVQCSPDDIMCAMESSFPVPAQSAFNVGVQTGLDGFPTPYRINLREDVLDKVDASISSQEPSVVGPSSLLGEMGKEGVQPDMQQDRDTIEQRERNQEQGQEETGNLEDEEATQPEQMQETEALAHSHSHRQVIVETIEAAPVTDLNTANVDDVEMLDGEDEDNFIEDLAAAIDASATHATQSTVIEEAPLLEPKSSSEEHVEKSSGPKELEDGESPMEEDSGTCPLDGNDRTLQNTSSNVDALQNSKEGTDVTKETNTVAEEAADIENDLSRNCEMREINMELDAAPKETTTNELNKEVEPGNGDNGVDYEEYIVEAILNQSKERNSEPKLQTITPIENESSVKSRTVEGNSLEIISNQARVSIQPIAVNVQIEDGPTPENTPPKNSLETTDAIENDVNTASLTVQETNQPTDKNDTVTNVDTMKETVSNSTEDTPQEEQANNRQMSLMTPRTEHVSSFLSSSAGQKVLCCAFKRAISSNSDAVVDLMRRLMFNDSFEPSVEKSRRPRKSKRRLSLPASAVLNHLHQSDASSSEGAINIGALRQKHAKSTPTIKPTSASKSRRKSTRSEVSEQIEEETSCQNDQLNNQEDVQPANDNNDVSESHSSPSQSTHPIGDKKNCQVENMDAPSVHRSAEGVDHENSDNEVNDDLMDVDDLVDADDLVGADDLEDVDHEEHILPDSEEQERNGQRVVIHSAEVMEPEDNIFNIPIDYNVSIEVLESAKKGKPDKSKRVEIYAFDTPRPALANSSRSNQPLRKSSAALSSHAPSQAQNVTPKIASPAKSQRDSSIAERDTNSEAHMRELLNDTSVMGDEVQIPDNGEGVHNISKKCSQSSRSSKQLSGNNNEKRRSSRLAVKERTSYVYHRNAEGDRAGFEAKFRSFSFSTSYGATEAKASNGGKTASHRTSTDNVSKKSSRKSGSSKHGRISIGSVTNSTRSQGRSKNNVKSKPEKISTYSKRRSSLRSLKNSRPSTTSTDMRVNRQGAKKTISGKLSETIVIEDSSEKKPIDKKKLTTISAGVNISPNPSRNHIRTVIGLEDNSPERDREPNQTPMSNGISDLSFGQIDMKKSAAPRSQKQDPTVANQDAEINWGHNHVGEADFIPDFNIDMTQVIDEEPPASIDPSVIAESHHTEDMNVPNTADDNYEDENDHDDNNNVPSNMRDEYVLGNDNLEKTQEQEPEGNNRRRTSRHVTKPMSDLSILPREEVQKTRKRKSKVVSKRPRKIRRPNDLRVMQVGEEERNENDQNETRRSRRQRFPILKFWKNETVRYERRVSQAMPTIAQVVVDVADSEDDEWLPAPRSFSSRAKGGGQ